MEGILVAALSQPPCTVLFSGGRDSSVILAAAADVARRHGLPEPIPLTMRAPDQPETWEAEWQERTIRHLGLAEWRRIEVSTQLDTLGPLATDTIRRFGVYWPSNAHNMRYFAREAGGGTLLTGGGGDELFSPWYLRRQPIKVLARRRPLRRAAEAIVVHQLPLPVRRRIIDSRYGLPPLPWLRGRRATRAAAALRRGSGRGVHVGAELEAALSSRYTELVRSALETFARVEGVRLVEPFYDAGMVQGIRAGGAAEWLRQPRPGVGGAVRRSAAA